MPVLNKASLPKDGNSIAMQLIPASATLARTENTTLSSSQTITFAAGTTFIRTYTTVQDIYLKWGTTAVTNANFDDILPAGQIVDFLIPADSAGTKVTAITLLERTASAKIIVIEK